VCRLHQSKIVHVAHQKPGSARKIATYIAIYPVQATSFDGLNGLQVEFSRSFGNTLKSSSDIVTRHTLDILELLLELAVKLKYRL